MILALLFLLLKQFELGGNKLGDDFAAYTNKYLAAECRRESDKLLVCTDDRTAYRGYKAYSWSSFEDGRLIYLSYIINGKSADAVRLISALVKDYGEPLLPSDEFSTTVEDIWRIDNSKLVFRFLPKADSNLGRDIISVTIMKDKGY